MYVCMYVCMYVYMYICMYVCMYVRIYVCMYKNLKNGPKLWNACIMLERKKMHPI